MPNPRVRVWDTFEFAFIYLFFVETQNRTLEELTSIFRGRNRVQRSVQRTEVLLRGKEGVSEVGEKEV